MANNINMGKQCRGDSQPGNACGEDRERCRLDDEDIALAKRLGLNPRSLIKNIPSKSEPWKAPVKDWLHEIEAKRSKKAEQKQRRREKEAKVQDSADKEK